ncbi:MAG: indolepyruvate oxidoreductase subunit beta, partial [Treponema sp.]|nr:indolepyruvate oxidoreductase subunit beta [Treponema sp.]
AAVGEGLTVRQSEVHGMAQRGGAVLAHLRISDEAIASDLTPKGSADIIISMEPLESLRYTSWLAPSGILVSAAESYENISNYPEMPKIIDAIQNLPSYRIIDAAAIAKKTGNPRVVNTVMVGAASPFLPVQMESLESTVAAVFAGKDPAIIEANVKALHLGREASEQT